MTPAPRRFESRPYQQKAIADLRESLRTKSSVILCAPCGSGKTSIACEITAKAVAKGRSVLFMGDSTEIIDQTSRTMDDWGVSHGIIQAGNTKRAPWELTHVGTIQTLRNRDLPPKDIVWVDEAHLSRASSWHTVIQHYIDAGSKVIGLTATPCRLDGKGLGKLFQEIVYCSSVEELTSLGYLLPYKIFAPPAPSTKKVRIAEGDFRKDDLAKVMDKPKLIGNAVEHYLQHARGQSGIVAASGIEHSKHLAEAFRKAGVVAEHCDGTTPKDERRRILGALGSGEITVLCQVDICGKGFDAPRVNVAIDCRPTQSMARWLQFVLRVDRPFPGSQFATLLDHSGNVHRFGFPDEPREWSLDEAAKPKSTDKVASVCTCKQCFATFRPGPDNCPYCGALILKLKREIEVEDGKLEEIQRQRKFIAVEKWRQGITGDKRRLHFEELVRIGKERGYKIGWSRVKFKALYGQWPASEWLSAEHEDRKHTDPSWNAALDLLMASQPKEKSA